MYNLIIYNLKSISHKIRTGYVIYFNREQGFKSYCLHYDESLFYEIKACKDKIGNQKMNVYDITYF